ncbi:MAG: histidine kinase, partial [Oscillospiraceae bacterium]
MKKLNKTKEELLKYRHNMNMLFICLVGTLLATILLLITYNVMISFKSPNFFISIAVVVAIHIGVYVIFKKKIYNPIKKIEKAMEVVSEADNIMDFKLEIDKNSEMYDIASYLNKMIYKLKDFADREYTATLLVKQAELHALQTQINPHFLYNTLDSIRGAALNEGQQTIAKMTKALSGLFRYSISKKEELSTLREELKNVDNYMTIQQLRFSNKFMYVVDIDTYDEKEIIDCKIPKLTIQPIVENAIFHGLETKLGKGMIIISVYITQKRLIISIEDDGIGMSEELMERLNNRLLGNDVST